LAGSSAKVHVAEVKTNRTNENRSRSRSAMLKLRSDGRSDDESRIFQRKDELD
jgi:hypothetical protein